MIIIDGQKLNINDELNEVIRLRKEAQKQPVFKNGFTSWHETHFEVVSFIQSELSRDEEIQGVVKTTQENNGTGALYELAEQWTNEFELIYAGTEWGVEREFFDTIEEYLAFKNLE